MLDNLAASLTSQEIIRSYPSLDEEDVRATIAYATQLGRDVFSQAATCLVVAASERPGRDCILAFITSRTEPVETTDLVMDPPGRDFAATGVHVQSSVRCGKLITLDRSLFTGRLGRLSRRLMDEVDIRLKIALELQ